MELREILKHDKAENLNRMSKEKLFKLEEELKGITTKWINTQMQGKPRLERDKVKDKIRRIKKKVRKALYECGYCGEAKFNVIIDEATGDEREYMINDCGREECPYKDFFMENAVSKTDKALRKMLKEIG